MSDIGLSFPAWMIPLLIGVLYWPFLLVAGLVLVGMGIVVRGWFRIVLLGLAGVALLLCLSGPVAYVVSEIHAVGERRAFARTHDTLTAPLQIQGLSLPAGTVVTWSDERHQAISSVDLPGPTPILGATLTGALENAWNRWWSGTLAAEATLDGWPCGAGDVWLSPAGRPMRCTLAGDHQYQGLAIPAGSEVALTDTGQLQDLRLATDRTMALPSIAATLPAGGSLFLMPDGGIERAYVPEPEMLRVGDIALRFEIRWLYSDTANSAAAALRGDLAADTVIDGALAPAGSLVTVDLASHRARVAPKR